MKIESNKQKKQDSKKNLLRYTEPVDFFFCFPLLAAVVCFCFNSSTELFLP